MPSKPTKTTASPEPKKTAAKAAKPKSATAKSTAAKPATAKKTPTRAAKPAAPKAVPNKTTIVDTVRAVVDAAAAIVGAAVTVNAAIGPKKGRTARKVTKALDTAAGVTAAAVALVNLNRADPDALASLKGIGPKRAQKIVESRPFQAVDDLTARKLLPKKAVDELRDRLSV
ncbi:helix-hairpin-helix domain-containing protein [Azospirillum sp. TSO22-1]|uniref:ComEA family DNA-binding protein n=1 Tax=Azospirillum sp. TSO22-1 TaxID=716789 RepID=UPI000D648AC3|nr:helix-hairpin-helix domain-containing protein [Azospirillum sp. TSO22-1]